MKYQGIRKVHEGKFITRYDVDYVTAEGHAKTYEIISRNRNIKTLEQLQNRIYNFPAGLIDPGETPEESARRELWEETGLTLTRIDDVLDNSYSAVGFANERNVCVFGAAAGEFRKSTSDVEEITPGWYTREEMRQLLRTQPFAARTQAYCYAWAMGK